MLLASAGVVPDSRIENVRSYYRSILPFYELESVSRAHLSFWVSTARSLAPNRILELGAGLGRITAALARVAPAVGVDVSLEMLARARARNRHVAHGPLFVAGDIRHPIARGGYDLVVAPGDPISHATAPRDRAAILRAAAAALTPSGRLVVEGLYRRRHRVAMPIRRVRHAGGVLTIEEAWFPAGARDLWHARYRYRDRLRGGGERTAEASFLARSWTPGKVRQEFARAGLAVESVWGDFDRRPFTADARRLIVVARRASSSIRAGSRARPSRRR
jgi:SAM-dependent methyltransferase